MSGLQIHKKSEIDMARARLEMFKRRSSGQSGEKIAFKSAIKPTSRPISKPAMTQATKPSPKPVSSISPPTKNTNKFSESTPLCESITLLVKIKDAKPLKKGQFLSYDLATRDASTDKFVRVISDDTIEVIESKDFRFDMNGSIDNDYYSLPTLRIIGGGDNPDMNSHKLTGNLFGFKTILSLKKGDKIRIVFDQDVTVDSFNMFIS